MKQSSDHRSCQGEQNPRDIRPTDATASGGMRGQSLKWMLLWDEAEMSDSRHDTDRKPPADINPILEKQGKPTVLPVLASSWFHAYSTAGVATAGQLCHSRLAGGKCRDRGQACLSVCLSQDLGDTSKERLRNLSSKTVNEILLGPNHPPITESGKDTETYWKMDKARRSGKGQHWNREGHFYTPFYPQLCEVRSPKL